MMMDKEQKRLLAMREENKISEADYQLISAALTKKSIFASIENSVLINPFQKIAGFKALLLGLILMVIMSSVGIAANVYFDGIIGFVFADNIKAMKPNFFLLLYQNAVVIFILASLFLAAALLLRQKRIRAIDFFGTVALSRYPILFVLPIVILQKYLEPHKEDISKGFELHLTLLGTIGHFVFLICIIWQITTYFFALKEASGLEGRSLWLSFIVTVLLGDVIGLILTRFFLYV
ncbi:hypothetical protein [Legionella nautarum]|nr:hypothetical protein [Legionella nautarum]